MSAPTWVTIVAYDTPFLAQMATERLDEQGIGSRLLSDSGGETLPHISFATGGYRVQVSPANEEAARTVLAALDDAEVGDIDVGDFTDEDGVQPPSIDEAEAGTTGRSRSPLVIVTVLAVIVGAVVVLLGVLESLR